MDLPHPPLLDWSASVSKLDILELRTQSIRAGNILLHGFGIQGEFTNWEQSGFVKDNSVYDTDENYT